MKGQTMIFAYRLDNLLRENLAGKTAQQSLTSWVAALRFDIETCEGLLAAMERQEVTSTTDDGFVIRFTPLGQTRCHQEEKHLGHESGKYKRAISKTC